MKSLHTNNPIKDERGTTMMEAMMVLPILLSTVFFIVWYSRTMHESNMINEAMYRAGKIASTVPNLDIDLSSPGEGPDVANPSTGVRRDLKEFNRARKANEFVMEGGVRFLESVGYLQPSGERPLLTLTKELSREKPEGGQFTYTVQGEMLSLLPAECVTYTGKDGDGVVQKFNCNNKILNLGYSDDTPIPAADKSELQSVKVLLKRYPIKIISIANVKSSLFHSGVNEKEFNFYVVREPIPAGPFTQAVEDELGNGDVGGSGGNEGIDEPLAYGVGPDEVPVAAPCAKPVGYLIGQAQRLNTKRIYLNTQDPQNPSLCRMN